MLSAISMSNMSFGRKAVRKAKKHGNMGKSLENACEWRLWIAGKELQIKERK